MNTSKIKYLGGLALLGVSVSFGAANAATVNGQEYVHLVSPDTSLAVGQNSFVLGTNWSDGEAPSAGKDYLVALQGEGGIIASANHGALAFSGRSLTLGNAETGDAGWRRARARGGGGGGGGAQNLAALKPSSKARRAGSPLFLKGDRLPERLVRPVQRLFA